MKESLCPLFRTKQNKTVQSLPRKEKKKILNNTIGLMFKFQYFNLAKTLSLLLARVPRQTCIRPKFSLFNENINNIQVLPRGCSKRVKVLSDGSWQGPNLQDTQTKKERMKNKENEEQNKYTKITVKVV